jgi:predicted nucleic acid-binding protein
VIRAVLDANILARGIAAQPGTAVNFITESWLRRDFQLVVSQHVIDMLRLTLEDDYFKQRISNEVTSTYLAYVWSRAERTALTERVHGVGPDSEDDRVIATAVSGGAQYLVTVDRQLREVGAYKGVTILDPYELCNILRAQEDKEGS